MRSVTLVLVLGVAACGADLERAGDDAPGDIDATSGTPADARRGEPMEVSCTEYEWTMVATNGRTTTTTVSYAQLDIGPSDEFLGELCGQIQSPAADPCPAGATCSGEMGPTGARCVTVRTGEFLDGRLTMLCRQRSETRDAGGAVVDVREWGWASIRVTRL